MALLLKSQNLPHFNQNMAFIQSFLPSENFSVEKTESFFTDYSKTFIEHSYIYTVNSIYIYTQVYRRPRQRQSPMSGPNSVSDTMYEKGPEHTTLLGTKINLFILTVQ